jgi:hypothetical protein
MFVNIYEGSMSDIITLLCIIYHSCKDDCK